jgi:hypothetical protein
MCQRPSPVKLNPRRTRSALDRTRRPDESLRYGLRMGLRPASKAKPTVSMSQPLWPSILFTLRHVRQSLSVSRLLIAVDSRLHYTGRYRRYTGNVYLTSIAKRRASTV